MAKRLSLPGYGGNEVTRCSLRSAFFGVTIIAFISWGSRLTAPRELAVFPGEFEIRVLEKVGVIYIQMRRGSVVLCETELLTAWPPQEPIVRVDLDEEVWLLIPRRQLTFAPSHGRYRTWPHVVIVIAP